jgi:hypothetical protein
MQLTMKGEAEKGLGECLIKSIESQSVDGKVDDTSCLRPVALIEYHES